ncbi:MAG: polysaccharide biosynthesis C-terminal domain-containing protein, partial [Bilifractor sp.]|nr:polysaccharide biosynthesis C-terminal domain-containing protein [Bilifractor sp.]
ASASTSAMMPEVSGKYAIGRFDELNRQVNQTLRLTMFICIPCMIGLTVLAKPIMGVLFPSASELAEKLLFAGSVFVVTDSFSIVTGGVLQAIGKQHVALVNAGISLVVNLASLAIMLFARPGLDIYAVMLSNIIFSLVCCFLNILSMKKHLRTRHEIRKTYVEPLASSVIMGAVAWLIYTALFHLTRRPFIGLLVAILVAIVVYLVSYVVISKTTEEEMYRFPMGGRIVKFLRLIRIYH